MLNWWRISRSWILISWNISWFSHQTSLIKHHLIETHEQYCVILTKYLFKSQKMIIYGAPIIWRFGGPCGRPEREVSSPIQVLVKLIRRVCPPPTPPFLGYILSGNRLQIFPFVCYYFLRMGTKIENGWRYIVSTNAWCSYVLGDMYVFLAVIERVGSGYSPILINTTCILYLT